MAERIVVVGGVRSGKTAVAEGLVAGAGAVTYVATGHPSDPEMAARIDAHRHRRPPTWTTLETCDLGAALHGSGAVVVDSLGLWVADRMTHYQDAALVAEADAFWASAAVHPTGPVVVVAEEAGEGLVPTDPDARHWLDLLGSITQRLARDADRVLLTVAGRVVELSADPAATPPPPRVHGDAMVPPGALDFAVNVRPQGPPAHVREAIDRALADLAPYPDDTAARRSVARRHGRDPAEVAVTAGAAEAFWLLVRAAAPRSAAVVHPMFAEPEAALRGAGVPVARVFRHADAGWALDPAAVPAGADLVVVGNPNNPTGTLDHPATVARLCRPGRMVVVDEAFMDFVPGDAASLAGRADLPGLVVIRSVTKLWGLAGLRAGYLIGPAELINRCAAARQPWPVSGPALAAVDACVSEQSWREESAAALATARDDLARRLAGLPGVRVWPSAANFLLIRVPDGAAAHEGLLRRKIAVRPATFPGLDRDYLRVAVRDPDDNAVLVDRLADVLATAIPKR